MPDVERKGIQHGLGTAAAGEQQQIKAVIKNGIRNGLDFRPLAIDHRAIGNDLIFIEVYQVHLYNCLHL